jgi:uncharacterized protein
VALDSFLLEILQDPGDHGALRYVADLNVLYNPRQHRAYEVKDDIPVLLTSESRDVDDAEHATIMNDPTGRDTGRP